MLTLLGLGLIMNYINLLREQKVLSNLSHLQQLCHDHNLTLSNSELSKLMDVLDVVDCVKFTDDVNLFADYCLNKRSGLEHSWAGESTVTTKVKPVLGDVKVGLCENLTYSHNGQPEKIDKLRPAEFTVYIFQAVVVKTKKLDNFNRQGSDYSEDTRLVLFFNPSVDL